MKKGNIVKIVQKGDLIPDYPLISGDTGIICEIDKDKKRAFFGTTFLIFFFRLRKTFRLYGDEIEVVSNV